MTGYGEEFYRRKNTKDQTGNQIVGYYHAWFSHHAREIERKLAGMDHSAGEKLSCGVVLYSHLKNYILSGEERPDIIVACDDDGCLTDYALTLIRDYFAAHPGVNLLYGDEDRVTDDGEYMEPWLKADWSPDTFLSTFYFGNVFAIRSIALSVINPGARTAADIEAMASIRADSIEEQMARKDEPDEPLKSWIYGQLCLKLAQADGGFSKRVIRDGQEESLPVGHIPEILFHASQRPQPWDSNLIRESLTGRYSVESAASRLISIILPSRDNPEMLSRCVRSIEKHTRIPYELIIVDNGSSPANIRKVQELVEEFNEHGSAQYIYEEMPFNMSAFYNLGALHANGELLLFMHDDVVIQRQEWLSHLSEKAKLPHVGVVGVKLLYPASNIIQHAGIFSVAGTPVSKLQYRRNEETQYFGFNKGIRNVLAVTGACLMVRATVFAKAGGFNEKDFPACYSDVDFCYRVHEMGYYNVVRNNMYLYYQEISAPVEGTRALRDSMRAKELQSLRRQHPALTDRDPYYNPYLTQDPGESRFILDARNISYGED